MSRSPRFTHDLPAGPPPEVLDEIAAAWERAQALVELGLGFEIDPDRPGRAFGVVFGERLSAGEAVAMACGELLAV